VKGAPGTSGPAPPEELREWLALLRVGGIGPALFHALIGRFGSPGRVLAAPPTQLRAAGLTDGVVAGVGAVDWAAVDRDMAWASTADRHILTLHDPAYPPLLRQIHPSPPLLFVVGDLSCLALPQLAIVGSRNPTPSGRRDAESFARQLARHVTVTSGLAYGIDAAAHRGALAAGAKTLAVAGNGLDRVYPARHATLAREIAGQGALVAELPPGTPPRAEHFPRRNRVIAGLSLGTLVVEAAVRSGSLITARHAMEFGREVFALPGSIHNPLARGCHALIRDGAKLTERVEDILEELGPLAWATWEPAGPPQPPAADLDPEYSRLLDELGYAPSGVDALVERTGLTAQAVSSMLLILELRGKVASTPGGLYTRVTDEVSS
jgi:DNA processing protein